jgi:CHAD domain-containing protein
MRRGPEFAFDFASQDDAWLRSSLEKFGATCLGARQSLSLYLDTPDGAISKLGFGLGLRRQDKMTLTRGPRRAPASGRTRWTRFVEELSPAPHTRNELEVCLQNDAVREALELSVSRDAEESFFALQFGGAWLEICVDRSKIAAAGQEFTVATARCRQLSGGLTDFLHAVHAIADASKWRLCIEPTLVRARRRVQADWGSHVGAFPPRLGRAMDMREAFQTIAQACFDQFLLNEASVRDARDMEAVHQCRVALRRLRTALRLFRLRAGEKTEEHWRGDLAEFSALLRDARDLDVLLCERTRPLLIASSPVGSAALLNEIKTRRESAYDKLVEALHGPQARRFCLDLVLWIAAGEFGTPETWNESLVAFMRRRLSKATQNLLERGDQIETDSEELRHKTRIAAKNLRYSAEFFEPLASHKTARKRFKLFIEALKEIQEILGIHNDQIVASRFFATLAQEPRTSDPEGCATGVNSALTLAESATIMPQEEFLRKARRAFRSLADARPFWTKIPDGSKPRGQH